VRQLLQQLHESLPQALSACGYQHLHYSDLHQPAAAALHGLCCYGQQQPLLLSTAALLEEVLLAALHDPWLSDVAYQPPLHYCPQQPVLLQHLTR
jgi:hypothetical protein